MMSFERIAMNSRCEPELELSRRLLPGVIAHLLLLTSVYLATPVIQGGGWLTHALALSIIVQNGLRLLLIRTQPLAYPRHRRLWLACFGVLLLGVAACWATLCCYTIRHFELSSTTTLFVLLVMSGLASGSTTSLTPSLGFACAFLLMHLGIPLAFLLFSPSPHSGVSAAFAIYLFSLFLQVRIQNRSYRQAVVQRHKLRLSQIRQSKARDFLSKILENLPVALFCKDATDDYRFTLWNRRAQELFGLSKTDVTGKNDYDFFPKEQADFFRQKDEQTMCAGVPVRIEEEPIESRAHGRILLETQKVPILDQDGKPKYLLGISEDITQRRLMERELKEALARAESATAAKSQFLANMSHEIRTPLNGVIGMASILADSPLPARELQMIQVIRDSGEILLDVVSDILDFSRIEAGMLRLSNEPMSPIECVRKAIAILEFRASTKKLRLTHEVSGTLPDTVIGDGGRISQVLLNLIGNAVKFTERGGITVRVSSKCLGQEIDELLFEVKDTGIGIPPEDRERLFKPFSQLDSSTTRRYGGTGLGLAICKHLVTLMNGKIWVESTQGAGTSFFFTVQTQSCHARRAA